MKIVSTLIISIFFLSCKEAPKAVEQRHTRQDSVEKKKMVFADVSDFPKIRDTATFIRHLRDSLMLEVHDSPVQKETEEITSYKKVKLYGSDEDYFFIEYDWKVGSMANFPWKHQVLLTREGKHVKTFEALRFVLIKIFPKENPFLLIVKATARGNGGHEIYQFSGDTVSNVYEGYYDYSVQTYCAGAGRWVFEPNELKISIKDENKDGFNDIFFTGVKINSDDHFYYNSENESLRGTRENIKYVFLYDKKTGHFKAKEQYLQQ